MIQNTTIRQFALSIVELILGRDFASSHAVFSGELSGARWGWHWYLLPLLWYAGSILRRISEHGADGLKPP